MGSCKSYTNVKNLLNLELYCLWYNKCCVTFWNEILFCLAKTVWITVVFQKQHSSAWPFGSRRVIGGARSVAIFLLFVQSSYPSEHDVHITWAAQFCLDLLMDCQSITDTISDEQRWFYVAELPFWRNQVVAECVGMINTVWWMIDTVCWDD